MLVQMKLFDEDLILENQECHSWIELDVQELDRSSYGVIIINGDFSGG